METDSLLRVQDCGTSGLFVEGKVITMELKTHTVDDVWVEGANSSLVIQLRIFIEQFVHKVRCLKFKACVFITYISTHVCISKKTVSDVTLIKRRGQNQNFTFP